MFNAGLGSMIVSDGNTVVPWYSTGWLPYFLCFYVVLKGILKNTMVLPWKISKTCGITLVHTQKWQYYHSTCQKNMVATWYISNKNMALQYSLKKHNITGTHAKTWKYINYYLLFCIFCQYIGCKEGKRFMLCFYTVLKCTLKKITPWYYDK